MNCTGMYALCMYIQTVQVCTNCAGIYELYRYVQTVQSCTNCACMYKLLVCRTMQVCTNCAGVYKVCRCVQTVLVHRTMQACTNCAGVYKVWRYVQTVQVCTGCPSPGTSPSPRATGVEAACAPWRSVPTHSASVAVETTASCPSLRMTRHVPWLTKTQVRLDKNKIFAVCVRDDNNNNVHLSCAHQRPEHSHDTY